MNEDQENIPRQFSSLEEYLSFVRHEMRGTLFVTREGVSQALDGLAGKDCDKCSVMLKPAFEYTDKLKELIDELLSSGAFRSIAGKPGNDIPVGDLEILKSGLITMISHEVRTPLTIIKEGLSLVLDEIPGKLNPDQKKYLTDAKENTDRLIQAVESILHTSPDEIIASAETDL